MEKKVITNAPPDPNNIPNYAIAFFARAILAARRRAEEKKK